MEQGTTYITTATVRFYQKLYRFPTSEKYTWIIRLEDCPLCSENNRIHVTLSVSHEQSQKVVDILRHHFALNHIFDGSKATIIFHDKDILAIGTNGNDNYLDARDNLIAKPFSKLDIDITSLIVISE